MFVCLIVYGMIQTNKLEQKPKPFVDIITAFVLLFDFILIFYYHQCVALALCSMIMVYVCSFSSFFLSIHIYIYFIFMVNIK